MTMGEVGAGATGADWGCSAEDVIPASEVRRSLASLLGTARRVGGARNRYNLIAATPACDESFAQPTSARGVHDAR